MNSTKITLCLVLVVVVLPLCGCGDKLNSEKVTHFANELDKAEQERNAEAMCSNRSEQFFEDQLVIRNGNTFPVHRANKDEFCRSASTLHAFVTDYSVERLSQEVALSEDRKSAIVRSIYIQKVPQIDTPTRLDRARVERESLIAPEIGKLVVKSSKATYKIDELNRADDPIPPTARRTDSDQKEAAMNFYRIHTLQAEQLLKLDQKSTADLCISLRVAQRAAEVMESRFPTEQKKYEQEVDKWEKASARHKCLQ